MSKVIAFRKHIIDAVKTVETLKEVDWFDGQFNEDDLKEWSLNTPAAFVSVRRAPMSHHTTGEINIDLSVAVVVIVEDQYQPRDADEICWGLIETIADMANLNTFGFKDAAPATKISFERLNDPELRQNGVAIGIVEWQSGLTIGENKSHKHEFIYDPATGQRVMQTPKDLFLGRAVNVNGVNVNETVNLTPEEE